jgi:hypothetical protein
MLASEVLIITTWKGSVLSVKAIQYIAVFLTAPLLIHGSGTIDSSHPSSYGANIGWMNWTADSSADAVSVGEYVCSGWIYSANAGWINVGSGNPANHIQYQNNSASDYGVNYAADPNQPGVGILRGYAYGANIGWINFEATGNPRLSLFTGVMSGYAYSANCGWINLNDLAGNYVQTDHIAMGTDSNSNGIADAWEYLYFGGLLVSGEQNMSLNGSRQTLLQDYLAGVNPLAGNSAFAITTFSTNTGGTSSSVKFSSVTGRLYTIQVNSDLTKPLGWTDSGLGTFAPDSGTSTTRTVTQSSATKKFFRVVTMRPLP